MSALTNKPMLEASSKGAISPPLRKAAAAPVFKPDFERSLRMHPLTAVVVAVLVFAAVVGYALLLKPTYEAESLVYLAPGAAKVLDDGSGGLFDSTRYDSYVQQQIQTASRLDILTTAVHAMPAGVWRGAGEPDQSAAERLQHSLKIERVLNSYQLSFTLRGPTAQGTAQALNAVVSAYLNAGRKEELTTADQRADILIEEKNRVEAELASARAEQSSLSTSLGMANPGMDSSNPYDSELSGLRAELASAREAHDVAAAQLASVSGGGVQGTEGLTAAADELSAGDAGLSSMKATISQRRAILSGQMAGLTPENPIYRQDAVELSNLDRSLEVMTTQVRDKAERRLQDKLRTDLARTGDVEARLNGQLAQETGAATSASPKLQRASELTADIARLMKRYATVDDALRGVQLETNGPGTAHLALAASAPASPMPSKRKLLLLAAIPLALLCGAFAAVFARKRDPRVYTGRDIEELLGFTPIAVLPSGGEVASGVMEEYILRLAGGIEGAYRVSGARTFVMAPAGAPCDVESLLAPLERQLEKLGLSVSSVTAREVMTSAPAAEPVGSKVRRPEGLVAARLETMMRRYDLLFIDAPALLTSAETEYLVRCADATILVADAGVTRRSELLQAALLLERLQVRGVGAVLEGVELRFADVGFRKAIADLEAREAVETRSWTREVEAAVPVVNTPAVPVRAVEVENPQPVVHMVAESAAVIAEPLPRMQMQGEAVAMQDAEPEQAREQIAAEILQSNKALAGADVEETRVAPVERGEEVPEVMEPAPARPKPMHRSVPVRRVTEMREGEGGWLKRLFVRDATPIMSIIPDEDDEVEEEIEAAASAVAMPGFAARLPEALDLPHAETEIFAPVQATVGKANEEVAPEDAVASFTVPEDRIVAEAPVVPRVEVVEHTLTELSGVSEPGDLREEQQAVSRAETEVSATTREHAIMAVGATDQVADREGLPSSEVLGDALNESTFVDRTAESPELEIVMTEAVAEVGGNLTSGLEALPVEIKREPHPVSVARQESLRVARWEAADLPARVEVTPWRDRRTSVPNAAYGPPERRFNWNTVDTTPSGSSWPVAPARPALEPRAPATVAERPAERAAERPRHVQAEEKPESSGRLTRQWGLLSRFGGSDGTQGERESGDFSGDSGSRSDSGFRSSRGRRRG